MPTQATSGKDPGLAERLAGLSAANPDSVQAEVLTRVNAWRKEKMEAARMRFEASGDPAALLAELSAAMDETVSAIYGLLMPARLGVAVVASGGYGRGEMFPHSDVDLLFLYRPAARGQAERLARTMLYILWDCGLKVGHALRSVDDALELAREDLTIRTNLLDARLIIGDGELFAQLADRFVDEIVKQTQVEFVEMKLAERDERHRRYNDSRYLLEPNIKESKGALRDLHTLGWIAHYAFGSPDLQELVRRHYITRQEYQAFNKARLFLWKLRAHLHYLAGKPEERLTFDRQQAIAEKLGYRDRSGTRAVERMMKRYFMTVKEVGNFTRIVCALLEDQHKRKLRQPLGMRLANLWRLEGFALDGERLQVKSEEEFTRDPLRLLKLFAVAQKHGYDIHPRALQLVSRHLRLVDKAYQADPRAGALFLEILLSPNGPEQTLRRMNEVGLLGKFIPEFGRIVGQMQFNMYHIYTVDEHIIVALGILHAIESGKLAAEMPLASEIIRRIQSRRVLYVSLLCHDIGKGQGEDQCELGAELVRKVALRLGLTMAEAECAQWLVGNHLLFTHTAFKRDAGDPQTLRDFIDAVKSMERLRLLLCLTVADMRAVGPGIWNAWKGTLLRNLYYKTERCMHSGKPDDASPRAGLEVELHKLLPRALPKEIGAYLALAPEEYLSALDAPTHAIVAGLLMRQQAEGDAFMLDVRHDTKGEVTTLTVVSPDQHALFSRLAGAISLAGANIITAKIFTLKDGTAVDIFHIQDAQGKAFDQKERLARMSLKMRQAVAGEIDLVRELAKQKPAYASRKDAFAMPGQVFIENEVSATHTVIEVVGRDRLGFLYSVTRALSDAGLAIGSAHISTYGAQAVDVFYVKDAFGMKIIHDRKQQELREALLAAVGDADVK